MNSNLILVLLKALHLLVSEVLQKYSLPSYTSRHKSLAKDSWSATVTVNIASYIRKQESFQQLPSFSYKLCRKIHVGFLMKTVLDLVIIFLCLSSQHRFYYHCTKNGSFPLRISPVNLTKSAVSCGFGDIYRRNP